MERCRLLLALLLGVATISERANADVLVVGPAPVGGSFASIQPAVNAAQDGDVILVHAATSPGFTIDGKSLTVQAWPGRSVQVQGTVTVRNVPANGVSVLDGLTIQGTSVYPKSQPGLLLMSNPGLVRVQDCVLRGGNGGAIVGCANSGAGGNGATIQTTPNVLLQGCTIRGGAGYGESFSTCLGGLGGHGVETSESALALYDCEVTGGMGGTADAPAGGQGGKGGDALRVLSWGVFVSAVTLRGGQGGEGDPGGNGGDGLRVETFAQARIVDADLFGGAGGTNGLGSVTGAPGVPSSGGGLFSFLQANAAELAVRSAVSDEDHLVLEVTGKPDHTVWLFTSRRPAQRWIESWSGLAAFPIGTRTTLAPIGTIPWSGTLLAEVPALAPPGESGPMWVQALVRSPSGQFVLSSPRVVTVLHAAGLQPDCNVNGKLDLCDILFGSSVDLDLSGVPDECELLNSVWHVDASAPGGGNGSVGAPFQTLSQAFLAAQHGDTIEVADGIYTGAGNRNLTSSNRSLTLRSVNGAGACIVDLQDSGFALRMTQTGSVVVEGFTFLNSNDSALWATNDGLEVVDCTFQGCSAPPGGGAIFSQARTLRVRQCRFVGNDALHLFSPGGGAVYAGLPTLGGQPSLAIEDCVFKGNTSNLGGALVCTGELDSALVARCTFLGNTATSEGGGLYVESGQGVQIESCLFAGNTAMNGGAVAIRSTFPMKLALRLCTLVSNQASGAGGGLFMDKYTPSHQGVECLVADSILWGNLAPLGAQMRVGPGSGTLDVRFSDVQGAQAGVSVAAGGLLVWGAGNLNVDPLFADPDGPDNTASTLGDNDWRLGALSPCIDSGSNPLVPQDAFDQDGDRHVAELTPLDLDGQVRRFDDPSAPNTGAGKSPIVDLGAYERP